MKNRLNILTTIIISVGIGLLLGYFLFNKKSNEMSAEVSAMHHNHSEAVTQEAETIYTCSMHPQVRSNEQGLCPICAMDLTPLTANDSDDPLILEMTEESVKLANIETTIVGKNEKGSKKMTPVSGKVQVDERLASSLVTHLTGRVEKLYVTFTGESVQKGQKLADIYAPDLITAQQALIEALKIQDINPNLVEAARSKLRLWKISSEAIQEIEDSKKVKEIFPLFAEESGIVMNKKVAVGDYLQKGQPLFEVINISKVWVLFDAYEEDLKNIKVGDKVSFTAAVAPNKSFQSSVSFIDPLINPATRAASIRTEVSNVNGLLKPAMFVNGTIEHQSSKQQQQLTVPKSAVLWTGQRSLVYVKVPDRTIPSFQFREVSLGEAIGNQYLISGGLEAGEEVVTHGSFTIDAAAQLNNQASMMNQHVQVRKAESIGHPNYRAITPLVFKEQLNDLANEYILLKDALIDADPIIASSAAQKVSKRLSSFDEQTLEGEGLQHWQQLSKNLITHNNRIAASSNIETQRQQFKFFSDMLIEAIDVFGTAGEAIYVQYCPMALDNEGANWLSREEEVLNPYFGDKMLRCGLVKRTFSSLNEN